MKMPGNAARGVRADGEALSKMEVVLVVSEMSREIADRDRGQSPQLRGTVPVG